MAERVGFEPTAHCWVTGFQDQLLKPLGHLSECYCNILARSKAFVNHKMLILQRRLQAAEQASSHLPADCTENCNYSGESSTAWRRMLYAGTRHGSFM